jgi:hypothetical protein
MMLRQAQHEGALDFILTLSLSKGEEQFSEGKWNGPADHSKRRTPRVWARGRDEEWQ